MDREFDAKIKISDMSFAYGTLYLAFHLSTSQGMTCFQLRRLHVVFLEQMFERM